MRCVIDTPLGPYALEESEGAIIRVGQTQEPLCPPATPLLAEAARQLTAYFAGELRTFSLPLRPQGTAFQQRCWEALCKIPYGQTISYGEQARRIGKPGAARAVGGANRANPICILIPCHRVIGANGALTGYNGRSGVDTKAWLLAHEGALRKTSK